VVSCSPNLCEMSCVFSSALRRIILHVWGSYILCVLAAEFLVTIHCISTRFPAMNSEQEFLDWSSPGTSFLLLRCVTPVSFFRYATKIVISADCKLSGFWQFVREIAGYTGFVRRRLCGCSTCGCSTCGDCRIEKELQLPDLHSSRSKGF